VLAMQNTKAGAGQPLRSQKRERVPWARCVANS